LAGNGWWRAFLFWSGIGRVMCGEARLEGATRWSGRGLVSMPRCTRPGLGNLSTGETGIDGSFLGGLGSDAPPTWLTYLPFPVSSISPPGERPVLNKAQSVNLLFHTLTTDLNCVIPIRSRSIRDHIATSLISH
jgi:hypothetical protein